MSDQAPQISIVIPCRNEARRLPATLEAMRLWLDVFSGTVEVIIVVERSDDGTEGIAQGVASQDGRFRAICNPSAHGKGCAVKTGMLAAAGEIVFFMDADLSVPLRFVEAFLPAFADADVVIGSRRHRESVIVHQQPLRRVVMGRAFNWGLRLLGLASFKDTQCGFKALTRQAAREVFSRLTLDGFTFDVEMLVLARALGYRITALPVEWSDAPGSKVKALRDGVGGFFEAVLAGRRARTQNRL